MYWTSNTVQQSCIHSANMDGSDSRIIVKDNINELSGLAFDIANQRIYWLDPKRDMIESCDMKGHFRKVNLLLCNSHLLIIEY